MFTFAAIVPHPPLLTPSFEKKAGVKLDGTKKALRALEEDVYVSKTETLVVITPHAPCLKGAFTINMSDECTTNYTALGDLATAYTYAIDIITAEKIKDLAYRHNMHVQMLTDNTIDHGVGVPLQFLCAHSPKMKIVPVGVCGVADAKTHFNFGYLLKEMAMASERAIGIIASADLSHALTTDAPAGFKKEGTTFDKKLQEALRTGNAAQLLTWKEEFVEAAAACGFKPVVTLMGALQRMHYTPKMLSYEAPHGVGYLVAHFAF